MGGGAKKEQYFFITFFAATLRFIASLTFWVCIPVKVSPYLIFFASKKKVKDKNIKIQMINEIIVPYFQFLYETPPKMSAKWGLFYKSLGSTYLVLSLVKGEK